MQDERAAMSPVSPEDVLIASRADCYTAIESKSAVPADPPMDDAAESTVWKLQQHVAELRARIEALQQSTSWKITAPLRAAVARLRATVELVRGFHQTVLKDHHQPVPIKTIADFEKTDVSYQQRIINESWTFDTKPRDPDTGNEIAIDNLFVLKYLVLERRLSAYEGNDYWDFIRHVVNSRDYTSILSVGSGPCAVEIEIAEKFTRPYLIDCLDLNENLINAATARARDRGIDLKPVVADLNEVEFKKKYDLVIICAALHHFVELEAVLERLHDALAEDGLFVTYEPVMRSGMFLYPATRLFLGLLFLVLPSRLRVNHQDYPGDKRVDRYYHEFDRSGWTFESIRSGDIPALLPRYFRTVHYGRGMTFLRRISDSVYGANYRLDTRRDRILTDALCWLDRAFRAAHLLQPEGLFYIGARKRPPS